MLICPKAKECDRKPCSHAKPHEKGIMCDTNNCNGFKNTACKHAGKESIWEKLFAQITKSVK